MATTLGPIQLKNPVLTASGTFGNGAEYADFIDLNRLGGIVTKSVTPSATTGNPPPRVTETPSGMLNAIGLQNEGVDVFCTEILPKLDACTAPVFVNVAGKTTKDYVQVVERLNAEERIAGLEINVSCPNVKEGGMAFGVCAETCAELIQDLRGRTSKPMMVKLSPNVTDITAIAKSVEGAGADALVVANTLLGMVVDIETRRPILANGTGGLSGPAVRPVALRLVYQVSQAVSCPVVGVGGVATAEDAIAFLMCGASAVEVGTMNFVDPTTTVQIIDGLASWLEAHDETVTSIIGTLNA
jgi:dihydroorotate dehydrogenase (NAD+) catalytic subunit